MYGCLARGTFDEGLVLHEQPAFDLEVELELEHLLRYQLLLAPLDFDLLQPQRLQEYVHRVLLNLL